LLTYKNIFGITALILLAFFSFLMLRIIFIYIPVKNDAGFLQLKQEYIHITEWRVAFFTHVFTSMLVLVAGFTQFSKKFLKQQPRLHRAVGYVYVINILMVTGPSGLLMSFYANGGISSQTAFVLLSVLWIGFTAMGLYKAIKKDFKAHRIFMIRSFALTLSAITLRCWKVLLVNFTDIQPMDRYRIIAWLGWTLNLIIAEWIIYKYFNGKKQLFTPA
jgi:Na+/phosphate symporter